jgi:alpha,alpha-trehalose phosphorylase
MLHHERLRPPSHDYPADEWNVIEKAFHLEFLAQLETMLALGNGYLGMRGCPEEGGPNAENATLINGFYETCQSFTEKKLTALPLQRGRQQDHQTLRR